MALTGLLPPVILEIKTAAGDAYAGLNRFQSATRAAMAETAAAAEAAAAKADQVSADAAANAERLGARVKAQNEALQQQAAILRTEADEAQARADELRAQSASIGVFTAEQSAVLDAAAVKAQAEADRASVRADNAVRKANLMSVEGATAASRAATEAATEADSAAAAAEVARNRALEAQAAVKEEGGRLSGAFAGLAGVGKYALMGVAAGTALVGYEAVKTGMQYQSMITLLQTGANESASKLGMVSSGIINMAGRVGQTTTSLANAMYLIESAGFHAGAGLNVLRVAAEGAATDGADLNTVGNALTTVLTDMHDKGNDAALVMSRMVAAVGQGKMKMQDFAGSIHNVLPNASALKISFADIAGALATMTAQGMSADQASQNLNYVITRLAGPTTVMTHAMAAYGISSLDVSRNLGARGLSGTLNLLYDAVMRQSHGGLALQSAFNANKVAAEGLLSMFNKLPPAMQPLANAYIKGRITATDYAKEIDKFPATQSVLGKQFAVSAKNAEGFSMALRAGQGDLQTITGALAKMTGGQVGLQVAMHLTGASAAQYAAAIKAISAAVPEAGDHVKNWAAVQQTLSMQIKQLQGYISQWVTQIGMVLIPMISTAITWLEKHTTVVKILAIAIGGVLVAAMLSFAATAATAAVAAAAALLPFIAIVAVIAIVTVAIYELATHWSTVWGLIKSVAASAWGWLSAKWHALTDDISAVWDACTSAVATAATDVWDVLKAVFSDIWEAMVPVRLAVAVLAVAFQVGFAAIELYVRAWWWAQQQIFAAFRSYILGPVVGAVESFWHQVTSAFELTSAVIQYSWMKIEPILAAIIAVGISPIVAAGDGLASAWSATWNFITSALQDAWNIIRPILSAVSGDVSGVLGSVDSAISTIHSAGSAVSGFLGAVGNAIPHALGTPYHLGGMALVGERGPELINLPRGTAVHSAQDTRGMLAGSGGAGIVEVHSNLYLDGQRVYTTVQSASLVHAKRNGFNGLSPVGVLGS